MERETTLRELVLPSGRVVAMEAPLVGGEDRDVSFRDQIPFQEVAEAIKELSSTLLGAIQAASPTEAEVELSLGVEAGTGRLMLLVADGKVSAGIKVRLVWKSQG